MQVPGWRRVRSREYTVRHPVWRENNDMTHSYETWLVRTWRDSFMCEAMHTASGEEGERWHVYVFYVYEYVYYMYVYVYYVYVCVYYAYVYVYVYYVYVCEYVYHTCVYVYYVYVYVCHVYVYYVYV